MRRSGMLFVMVMALGLVPGLGAAATAGSPVAATGPYVSVFGSWNTYGMSGANALIDRYNQEAEGSGRMDHIDNEYGLGVHLGTDLRRLAVGFGYERLFASSTGTFDGGFSTVRMRLPGNAWYGLAEFRLPSAGVLRARLGVAAGAVTLAPVTMTAMTFGTRSYAAPMTGSGALFQGYLTGAWAGPSFDVFASAGYRFAKVSKPHVTDIANLSETPEFAVDYSGTSLRAGLKLHLRK